MPRARLQFGGHRLRRSRHDLFRHQGTPQVLRRELNLRSRLLELLGICRFVCLYDRNICVVVNQECQESKSDCTHTPGSMSPTIIIRAFSPGPLISVKKLKSSGFVSMDLCSELLPNTHFVLFPLRQYHLS